MADVKQLEGETVKRTKSFLRHMLEWADETPLPEAARIKPVFPAHLQTARLDGKEKPLSPVTQKKTCDYVRLYFIYARRTWPKRYHLISDIWIETIRPARSKGTQSKVIDHEFYSEEEMLKIANVSVETLTQERDRAAACFLYLSGMRADAFVSLPIKAVDIAGGRVQQLPELGVRTKNSKAAKTSLLPFQELTQIAMAWDQKVRAAIPEDAVWYSPLNREASAFDPHTETGESRKGDLERGLHSLCKRTGIPYKSPHKFRHGHVVYAIKRAKNLEDLKAISQNVMHANVGITDGLYGSFLSDDVHDVISGLGEPGTKTGGNGDLEKIIKILLALADADPSMLAKLEMIKKFTS
jgi:integrase